MFGIYPTVIPVGPPGVGYPLIPPLRETLGGPPSEASFVGTTLCDPPWGPTLGNHLEGPSFGLELTLSMGPPVRKPIQKITSRGPNSSDPPMGPHPAYHFRGTSSMGPHQWHPLYCQTREPPLDPLHVFPSKLTPETDPNSRYPLYEKLFSGLLLAIPSVDAIQGDSNQGICKRGLPSG